MIDVTSAVRIDESEIVLDFVRASGPGGQNVNKVASSVQLRFDVSNTPSLSPHVKVRLMKLAGSRMTADGILFIDAHRYRTQEQNRQDALDRLVELVRQALVEPKTRRKTRPTAASKQRRLEAKRQRSITKRQRQKADLES